MKVPWPTHKAKARRKRARRKLVAHWLNGQVENRPNSRGGWYA